MLSLDDCVALSDLAADEIAAIAEHEHLPFIVALEKGCDMLRHPWGDAAVRQMVWDNLRRASHHRRVDKVAELRLLFRDTCGRHPNRYDRRRRDGARDPHPFWSH